MGPRAGLDTEARGKILCPCRGSNPDRPFVQPVVRHYTAWERPVTVRTVIWSWAPEGARHQDRLVDWPSTVKWLGVWGTDLSLREVQRHGDLVPPQPREVVGVAELCLQLADLQLGEGGALFAGLRLQPLRPWGTQTAVSVWSLYSWRQSLRSWQ
jgi:hypothetical protein